MLGLLPISRYHCSSADTVPISHCLVQFPHPPLSYSTTDPLPSCLSADAVPISHCLVQLSISLCLIQQLICCLVAYQPMLYLSAIAWYNYPSAFVLFNSWYVCCLVAYQPMLGTIIHQPLSHLTSDTLPISWYYWIISCLCISFRLQPTIDFTLSAKIHTQFINVHILC